MNAKILLRLTGVVALITFVTASSAIGQALIDNIKQSQSQSDVYPKDTTVRDSEFSGSVSYKISNIKSLTKFMGCLRTRRGLPGFDQSGTFTLSLAAFPRDTQVINNKNAKPHNEIHLINAVWKENRWLAFNRFSEKSTAIAMSGTLLPPHVITDTNNELQIAFRVGYRDSASIGVLDQQKIQQLKAAQTVFVSLGLATVASNPVFGVINTALDLVQEATKSETSEALFTSEQMRFSQLSGDGPNRIFRSIRFGKKGTSTEDCSNSGFEILVELNTKRSVFVSDGLFRLPGEVKKPGFVKPRANQFLRHAVIPGTSSQPAKTLLDIFRENGPKNVLVTLAAVEGGGRF